MVSLTYTLSKMGTQFQQYSKEVRLLLFVLLIIICVISLLLTGLIIFILATTKKLRTPSNVLNSSLLGSGLILSTAVFPMTIIEVFVKYLESNELPYCADYQSSFSYRKATFKKHSRLIFDIIFL